jgi:hypothetical protein
MIGLVLTVSDGLFTMIGPGGLLLVVPHLFAVPVFSFIRGVAKK